MAEFTPLAPETVESERETYFTLHAEGLDIAQSEDYDRDEIFLHLTARNAWDLLEFLYKHRKVLYHSNNLALPGAVPAWIGEEPTTNTIEGSIQGG